MTLVMTDRAHQYCVAMTQVAQLVVCECKALRAHTRISAIQVSLIIKVGDLVVRCASKLLKRRGGNSRAHLNRQQLPKECTKFLGL
jgi:hypothetical protein